MEKVTDLISLEGFKNMGDALLSALIESETSKGKCQTKNA